jgi:hypothetical protein
LTHINTAAADAEVLASTNAVKWKMTLRRFGASPRSHCHIDTGRADKTAALAVGWVEHFTDLSPGRGILDRTIGTIIGCIGNSDIGINC